MVKKSLSIIILFLFLGFTTVGCPKKAVVTEDPSLKKDTEASQLQSEREAKEAKERELARIKEEEARRAREKEMEMEKQKEFEKSLVAKKTPGIEGEILESKLLQDIHFDFDKSDIRPQDTQILRENAALLMKYPNVKIQIEGHCDERGTNEYNLALGERRANNTKRYLVSLGISENRMSTISYGEEKPLDPGHHEEAWAKNRRCHFIILSK